MNFKTITLVIILCGFFSTEAQEISDTSFGKGLINFVAKECFDGRIFSFAKNSKSRLY